MNDFYYTWQKRKKTSLSSKCLYVNEFFKVKVCTSKFQLIILPTKKKLNSAKKKKTVFLEKGKKEKERKEQMFEVKNRMIKRIKRKEPTHFTGFGKLTSRP